MTEHYQIVDEKIKELEKRIEALEQGSRDDVISREDAYEKWIPVSERLPDKNDLYLVTIKISGKSIRDIVGFNINKGWRINGNDEVIAWMMPLPKPYQAESEE